MPAVKAKTMVATEKKIDAGISTIIKGLPLTLHSDISYLFKGKRMRSKLMMELATLVKVNLDTIVLPAVGVEMIHTISLIHDDVIDRQAERRGKATLHHLYDNRLAVLVGDFLLQGLVQQMKKYRYHPEVVKVLYEKIGELCKGEVLQDIPPKSTNSKNSKVSKNLKHSNSAKSAEREQYLTMVKQKTGSLFSYSFMVPLLARAAKNIESQTGANSVVSTASTASARLRRLTLSEKNLIRFAEECGYVYGIAFQLADDLADLEEDLDLLIESTGKENNDLDGGVRLPSYAVMAWAESDPKGFKQFCDNLSKSDSGRQSKADAKTKKSKQGKPTLVKVAEEVKENIKIIIQNEINESLRKLKEQVRQGVTKEYFDFLSEKVQGLFE